MGLVESISRFSIKERRDPQQSLQEPGSLYGNPGSLAREILSDSLMSLKHNNGGPSTGTLPVWLIFKETARNTTVCSWKLLKALIRLTTLIRHIRLKRLSRVIRAIKVIMVIWVIKVVRICRAYDCSGC
jgi:hypothetical protein